MRSFTIVRTKNGQRIFEGHISLEEMQSDGYATGILWEWQSKYPEGTTAIRLDSKVIIPYHAIVEIQHFEEKIS